MSTKTKQYVVSMGQGRIWTCTATSIDAAVAKFKRSGTKGYMNAFVCVVGGTGSYNVQSCAGWHRHWHTTRAGKAFDAEFGTESTS